MSFDPANPPLWLRKLSVAAAQISPADYPPTPEEGILLGCRLSDALHEWSTACAHALGFSPLPPHAPFDNPFRLTSLTVPLASKPRRDDAAR